MTVVTWDDALDVDANHDVAAMKHANALGWRGMWVGGGMPDGSGNCYVACGVSRLTFSYVSAP